MSDSAVGAIEALDRVESLIAGSPKLRDALLKQAYAGTLPNQERLGMSADQIDASLSGKRARVIGDMAAAESPLVAERAMLGFEAIVRQVGRPTLLVQDGTVEFGDRMDGFPESLDRHLQRIRNVVNRVGRVELTNHRMEWAGTAWLVEERLAITNRHVAELFAGRRGRGFGFLVNPAIGVPYGSRIDFRQEYERREIARVVVKAIRYIAGPNEPDLALLELQGDGALPEPVPLASEEVKRGLLIGVVGFPAYDSRNDPKDIAHYFGDIFDKKRFAPGYITQDSSEGLRLMHDCTTLGGNSGSIVFDLETGKAVGLHFAGSYLEGNFAVSVANIKSALAGEVTVRRLRDESRENERADSEHKPEHFSGRTGYGETFLSESEDLTGDAAGYTVPMPELDAQALEDAVKVIHDGLDTIHIPYCHFSVVYSSSRRMPRLTAVNIDAARYCKIKRADDQWFRDLRLPRELQLSREDYAHPAIDRGHMVRREDPNWGELAEAVLANGDTFHYTNSAPQHAQLNQNRQAWLGLEEYILGSAKTHGLRATVFTGPVLRDDDPTLEDTEVQVPREFWKVVVMIDADRERLHATGYVLGQGELIRDITEGFVFGEFSTYQVRIADIAHATGLDFGRLVNADPLARRSRREEGAGGHLVSIPIDSPEQAYLG
ncbi:DNA/RNA non-specific endonuclease [Cupriavidus sp. AcVe19-1a]|uniref:DNA/RNA non-specific endonuclease n=1 Tax=Cupriavidus sp. AcVe19-1a TaxID=2821359 RepID=UPI001AE1F110|nr:DNA/RNA non-specific endonuclease [Cupriavidus sp. AcVe19-1a]MBP0633070.1 DNA/RNA non-specific endonuclease [Cupriavidus sp. AcVe19-1a]